MADIAVELATGYISLAVSAKGLGSDVAKQFGAVPKAADKAGKESGSRLASGLKLGALGAGAAVAGLVGTALVKGFGRLTAIENATAKLTGLGHSAKTVQVIMDDALASVKGTAFGLDEAATVSAGAVAAGIKPGLELTKTLKLVADAATIGGSSLGEMGAIFNKVASSNKVQGDTINQLNDRGIPIVQLLAKQLGTTSGAVTKLASKGGIDFKTFAAAMESGLGGAALKSGETTTGAVKNMGAALSRFGASLLQGLFPIAKQVFGGLTGLLDKATSTVGPFADKFAGFITGLGPVVGRTFGTISAGVKAFVGAFSSNQSIDAFGGHLSTAAKAGIVVGAVVKRLTPVFWGVVDVIRNQVIPIVGSLARFFITTLIPMIARFVEAVVKKLTPVFAAIVRVIRDDVIPIVGSLARFFITTLVPVIAKIVEKIAKSLQPAFSAIVGVIIKYVMPAIAVVAAKFKEWLPTIEQVVKVVVKVVGAILGFAAKVIGVVVPVLIAIVVFVLKQLIPVFVGIITVIVKVITAVVKFVIAIVNAFGAIKNFVVVVFKKAWALVQGIIINPIRTAVSAIGGFFGPKGPLQSAFRAVKDWVIGAFKKAWGLVKGIITGPIDAAIGFIRKVLSAEKNGLQWIFSKAVAAVGKIWEGLQKLAKAPIKFIVNTVLNDGLISAFNWVSGKIGGPQIPNIPLPKGFASGGRVRGPGTGTSDSILARLSDGEFVTTADATKRNRGILEAIHRGATFGLPPGFAKGGRIVVPTMSGRINPSYAGHSGLDFYGRDGDPIFAATNERVNYTGAGRGYGDALFATAADGLQMVYGHTSAILAKVGQVVQAGQRIALIGHSGDVRPAGPAGAHLHFEVAPNGRFDLASNRPATSDWLKGADVTNVGGGGGMLGEVIDWVKSFKDKLTAPLARMKELGNSEFAQTVKAIPSKLVTYAVAKVKSLMSTLLGPSTAGLNPGNPANEGLGHNMMIAAGFGQAHWSSLRDLWNGESNWNEKATNASSGAYGIPQALPGSKMASAGADWRTNPATQIAWGLGYIRDVYGDPIRAFNTWSSRNPHWYDQGGTLKPGLTMAYNGTGQTEHVLTDRQWKAVSSLAAARSASTPGVTITGDFNGYTPKDIADELEKRQRDHAALHPVWS